MQDSPVLGPRWPDIRSRPCTSTTLTDITWDRTRLNAPRRPRTVSTLTVCIRSHFYISIIRIVNLVVGLLRPSKSVADRIARMLNFDVLFV